MAWIISIAILLLVIVIHESGHAFTTLALKVPIKEFVIGFPYPSIKMGKVRLSPILLGGGVVIDSGVYYALPAWKKILIAVMGPVANLVTGVISSIIFLGYDKGILIAKAFIDAGFESIAMLFTGKVPVSALVSPVGVAAVGNNLMHQYFQGALIFWLLLTFIVPIVNLIPVPGLDGGQILMSLVVAISGNRPKVILAVERISVVFLIILVTGLLILTVRDIANLF